MSPQDRADHLLRIWQERRDLPPEQRLPDDAGTEGHRAAWRSEPTTPRVYDATNERWVG